MVDPNVQRIAQALISLSQGTEPPAGAEALTAQGRLLSALAGLKAARKGIDGTSLAAIIRALCPAGGAATRAEDVAALVRELCPAATTANVDAIATIVQALSPPEAGAAPAHLEALVRALSPVEPQQNVEYITDVLAHSSLDTILAELSPAERNLHDALLSLALAKERGVAPGPVAGTSFSPTQVQAMQVLMTLCPVENRPPSTVADAARLLHSLCPTPAPADAVADLIAALSPAADRTLRKTSAAAEFLQALCPAGNQPAESVAALVAALSPARDSAAREVRNVAGVILALCPADGNGVAALVRALCPANEPGSDVARLSALMATLSPADVSVLDLLRALSPADAG